MDNSAANTDLIRGHVITIILRSLQGNDKYGYEICREIEVKSEGSYVLKQPTLYSCLKRLESQGYITSYMGDISNGGKRRYYSLTEKGEEFLERDKQEWEFSRTLINRLLSDKDYDLTQPPPFNPSDLRPYTRKIATFQTMEELANGQVNEYEPTVSSDEQPENETIEPIENEKVSFVSPQRETPEDTPKRSFADIFGTLPTYEEVEDNSDTVNKTTTLESPETVVNNVIQDIVSPTPVVTQVENSQTDNINYRNAFSKLFDTEDEPTQTAQVVETKETPVIKEEKSIQPPTISDLKKRYYTEGYNLKQYSRSNVSIFYNMNYVYANKLNTLTYWLMYTIILVEIGLTALFESSLGLGLGAYLTAIGVGLIIPGVPTILTILNPLKRIKAEFDFKRSIINRLLLFLNLSLIVACLGLFVWQVDLNNLSTMVKPILLPILYLLNLPLSSVVYYQIYKTKKFHLS